MKIVKFEGNLAIRTEDDNYLELFTTNNEKENGIEKTIEYLTDPTQPLPKEIDVDKTDMGEGEIIRAKNLKKFLDEYLEYRTQKIKSMKD